jgi:acetone carboxylase gamma subunit
MKGTGEYNPDFKVKALALKERWRWRCERCGHIHDVEAGYSLTIHHLDGDKSNDSDWNLACLCQRCHLSVQNRVFMPQSYMFVHSEWLKPHLEGYYKSLAATSTI